MTEEAVSEVRGAQRIHRPDVNLTGVERAARILVGIAATIAGTMLLAGTTSAIGVVLEILLVLAGLDLLVTGALGHCPLYHRLGYVPRSLRETQ